MQKKGLNKFKNKYIIPGLVAIFLVIAIILGGKHIQNQAKTSIYDINEATTNYDNIKMGDTINYEINGYSDWQVIGKDEFSGTIDIVSRTNTENLTLESNQTKEYYEQKLQDTANKYIDGNYAIKARPVLSNDLDNFTYNQNFWLNEVDDKKIMSSLKFKYNYYWEYKKYKLYLIPVIKIYDENSSNYNKGDIYIYENNGITEWVVESADSQYINLLPKTPIEVVIDNDNTDISSRETEILNSLRKEGVIEVKKYVVYNDTAEKAANLLVDFFVLLSEKIWLSGEYTYFHNRDGYIEQDGWGINYYENGKIEHTYGIEFCDNKTSGYRPVVTLKVKKDNKETKNIYSNFNIGDNVNYYANGYSNWKVLSIDNANSTVDIISGGIVKNITFFGEDDWNNYEEIIQREVDKYKTGENAISATTVNGSNILSVFNLDSNSIISRYWILSKTNFDVDDYTYNAIPIRKISYNVEVVYHNKYHDYMPEKESVKLYTKMEGDIENVYKNPISNYSYTAGLRPVITLKFDLVEKLKEEETKKIESSTEKQEKGFIKEQEKKNQSYKESGTVDDTTSSTSAIKSDNDCNDTVKYDSSNTKKIVHKDKSLYKYGFIIFLTTTLVELGIIIYMSTKIKK